jgi:hypothetical protein
VPLKLTTERDGALERFRILIPFVDEAVDD